LPPSDNNVGNKTLKRRVCRGSLFGIFLLFVFPFTKAYWPPPYGGPDSSFGGPGPFGVWLMGAFSFCPRLETPEKNWVFLFAINQGLGILARGLACGLKIFPFFFFRIGCPKRPRGAEITFFKRFLKKFWGKRAGPRGPLRKLVYLFRF